MNNLNDFRKNLTSKEMPNLNKSVSEKLFNVTEGGIHKVHKEKLLITTKINPKELPDDIQNKINKILEDPDEYLKTNENLIVGI